MKAILSPARLLGVGLLVLGGFLIPPAGAQSISNNAVMTVLTFDPPSGDLDPVPGTYGDRVTGSRDRFGNEYGQGSGGTSNVTVDFGPAGSLVRRVEGPYGDLFNVACQEDGEFGMLEVTLSADPGHQVALRRFDLAGAVDDLLLSQVEVLGAGDVLLHRREDVALPGFGGGRTRFDFATAPLVSGTIRIRVHLEALADTDSHLVGIDNIAFSQRAISGCPAAPRLDVTRVSRDTLVLSWPGTGYRLETTTTLGGVWSTLGTNSPVTFTATGSAGFFRLSCP